MHLDDVGAEAARVGRQVDGKVATVEAPVAATELVAGAEALRAQALRQRTDRVEAVVLHEHDDDLHPFLHRHDQLGRHHQVAAVADHREHVAAVVGEGHPEGAGDLVAHAGVAVLHVVALAVAHPPELVQVTGHRAGRAQHHVTWVAELVDGADHGGLGQQPRGQPVGDLVRRVVGRRHLRVPLAPQRGDARCVPGLDGIPVERARERREALAGVGDQREPAVLPRVETRDVEADEANSAVAECGSGCRREVGPAGADPDDEVGLGGEDVGGRRARGTHGPDELRVPVQQRALARLRLGDGDAGRRRERGERLLGAGVVHSTTGDQERAAGAAHGIRGVGHPRHLDRWAGDVPHPIGEELDGPVEGLGLHVLRQRDGRRAGLDRVGEHAHRAEQGSRQLFGAVDLVVEARQRPEGVVDRHVGGVRQLELLEHRRAHPGGEGARGQQQHRDAVDGGERGSGEHVGRAGPDGCRHGPGREPVAGLGVADGGVHHRLLVAPEHVGQARPLAGVGGSQLLLEQRLADAGDVAVAEDAQAPHHQALALAVALAPLVREEAHHRLRDGEPHGLHRRTAGHRVPPTGSRGSTCSSAQVSRTHAWAGSSQIRQARSGPGPAMTLR